MYLYTGVLYYKTVRHTSSLLVNGIHMYFDIKQFHVYVSLFDDD